MALCYLHEVIHSRNRAGPGLASGPAFPSLSLVSLLWKAGSCQGLGD